MNPLDHVKNVREALPFASPVPWHTDSAGLIRDAKNQIIFSPVKPDRLGGASEAFYNARVLTEGSSLAHDDFMFMVPEMVHESGEIGALQQAVFDQANTIFPKREPQRAWMKMFVEIGEVIEDPHDPLEWADVFIMMLDLSKMYNIDIKRAVVEKMAINGARTWAETDSGTYQHVQEVEHG